MQTKLSGKYQVTGADLVLFSDLLKVWEEITNILTTDHSKACKAYVEALSQLNIGDNIIVLFDKVTLDVLYNFTKNYGMSILCIYKKQPKELLKLEEFKTFIGSVEDVERSKNYTDYYNKSSNKSLTESKNI